MLVGFLILAVLLFALILWFLVPYGLRTIQTRRLRTACRKARAIVLTYDDGPSSDVSAPLIGVLDQQNVPATFFVLGRNAQARPELIASLQQGGHEIANHTQAHTNAWKVAPWVSNRDIHAGADTLRKLGVTTDLFRPTYGKTTLASVWYQLRHRVRFAYWTVDTRDSWDRRPVQDVLDEIQENGGGVILMHDFDRPQRGPAPDDHLSYVLNTTQAIIAFARKNNMNLCRFGDLGTVGPKNGATP